MAGIITMGVGGMGGESAGTVTAGACVEDGGREKGMGGCTLGGPR